MSNVQIFNHDDFGEVRTIHERGNVLFCGSDVAKCLGYTNPSKALSDHCKGVTKRYTPTRSGKQELSFIPESDLYRLVFRSKLPSAERFTDWVTIEVLPSIRRNGGYIAGQNDMTDAELMARAVLVAQKAIQDREQRILELTAQNEEMQPMVLFAQSVAASNSTILIGELAKILRQNGVDMGEKRLFAWMRENGYLIKRKGADYNMPTQRSMEMKLFQIKETVISHSDGHTTISKTPKVTGKGQQYFINLFLRKK